jgi:hypothetical protein
MFSRRKYIVAAAASALAIVAVALAATQHVRAGAVTIPRETAFHVALSQTLASNQNRPGDHFEATVTEPLVVNGQTVIPKGAAVTGMVVDARRSGRLKGRADLQLALRSVDANGKTYDLHTRTSDRTGGAHKKRNLALIGGGAGGGVLIGAIAGGGKGALIGGPIGAGAGTAVALVTGRKDIRLPAETRLTFTLAEPLNIG